MNDSIYIHPNLKTKWISLGTQKNDFIKYCLERYTDEFLMKDTEPRVEPIEES